MMKEDGFEEWDADFLDQLIQVEEFALSSTAKPNSNPCQPPPPFPASSSTYFPQPPQQQQSLYSVAVSTYNAISYSPPRELSQRITDSDFSHSPSGTTKCIPSNAAPSFRRPVADKDLEIERLKGELGRASKRLAHLENECHKLKQERDEKEEQLIYVSSKNKEKNARTNCSESINRKVISNDGHNDWERGILASDHCCISKHFQSGVSSKDQTAKSTYKATGVQTEIGSHQEAQYFLNDDLPACLDLSQKLLTIWGSPSDTKLGRNVMSKLLVGCQRSFHILFGHMSINLPSKITMELLTDRSSFGVAQQYLKDCFHTPEASKVSYLYLVLTKIADGTDMLETLIEPLLDLCGLENVVIVHSSLCILHAFLKHLLELEKNYGRRDSVIVEGCSGNDVLDSCGLEGAKDGKLFCVSRDQTSNAGCNQVQLRYSNAEMPSKKEHWSHQNGLLPHVKFVCLFEMMHHIVMRITEENVRAEAVSILNIILLRSNPYIERERVGQKMVFETISQLLKKDAGLQVKRHALRLLYLLLNCPKILVAFCCGCKEWEGTSATDDNASATDLQKFSIILQGLADCIVSHGSGLQELKLCRNAILVLAFLASSGKSGFEILVGRRLSRGVNYLMLILQVLVSELDLEAGACEELPEIFSERTFLIREILILLNRLVSSPSYSATVLRGLTNTRDMASLTIDVANRLSRKGDKIEQRDSMVKHIRETEIIELARVFKKRIFTYLGDDLP